MTQEEYDKIYQEGYKAYFKGSQMNPYDWQKRPVEHSAWDNGWYTACGDE